MLRYNIEKTIYFSFSLNMVYLIHSKSGTYCEWKLYANASRLY
jgi:hypothetical protein